MAKIDRIPSPQTAAQVKRLKPLRRVQSAPKRQRVNALTFRLPKGARASLVRVGDSEDLLAVRLNLPNGALDPGMPYESLPTERLSTSRLKRLAQQAVAETGFRPRNLPVAFLPNRVKLRRHELAAPPFDFSYVVRGERVDRPTNVFAPDDRYIYQDTSFPWSTVGRVDTPLGWCTGCTIGSRLLVVASHCIQWNPDNTAGWVRFRPAYYNGSAPFGEAWGTRVIFWSRATPADGLTDRETAFDYVVCVLDTRMGDIVGYPGYRTYDSSWNGGSYWQHMGYPTDLTGGQRPAFQGAAVISTVGSESTSGQTGYVLGHFNDVVPGHSGGPAWGWWAKEPWPRVVGVQSAEASVPANNTSGDNEFGGGPALSSLISWARSNYE